MKSFKRSFSTLACIDADIDGVIGYAVRGGMQGVEIRLDKDQKICGLGIGEAAEIRAKFADSGVAITDLATGLNIADYSADAFEKAKECIDLAAAVNTKAIRVFVGGYMSHFSDIVKENPDGIVRFLTEMCEYAAGRNVEVWAETHSSYSSAKAMCALVERVPCGNLKILWDVIHTIEFGESPAESVKRIGSRLGHVHFKDGRFSGDRDVTQYVHTKLGEGEIPVAEILTQLDAVGYDGYISLEWELPWRPEIRGCYADADETLAAYNKLLDSAAGNVFPPYSDERWTTFNPPTRALASFGKGKFGESALINLASRSFGVGKWVCTVPVTAGETYEFSVACRTAESENNVYVVLTQMDKNGKWLTRDHAANAVRNGDIIRFSDTVRMDGRAEFAALELWLKGRYADVCWYQPYLYPCAPLEKRTVRAAAVHMKPIGRTYDDNCARLLAAVDAAAVQKPDIIVLGECMYDRGISGTYRERSETENGRMVTLMREKAKQYGCYIIYNFHENDRGEYYNTSILLGRDGATVGKYRKTHLTLGELEYGLTPGDSYPVFDTDFGRIGMLICWDQFFSRTAEEVVKNGAEIIFVSTAGDASHKSMARAMDTGVYMVIAGMNAPQTAPLAVGPTRIVTPDGEVLAHTNEDLTPVVADIDLNEKKRMFWLSVGPAAGGIHGIYRYEKNPDSFQGE